MPLYFSASTGGFYDSEIHGARHIEIDGEVVVNLDCHIPTDAVEIDAEQHAALLAAQADGKMIAADAQGNPIAIDRPAPTADEIMASVRRKRDALLAASDWVVTRAVETGTPVPAEWSEYRQALRDITEQAEIIWPEKPL